MGTSFLKMSTCSEVIFASFSCFIYHTIHCLRVGTGIVLEMFPCWLLWKRYSKFYMKARRNQIVSKPSPGNHCNVLFVCLSEFSSSLPIYKFSTNFPLVCSVRLRNLAQEYPALTVSFLLYLGDSIAFLPLFLSFSFPSFLHPSCFLSFFLFFFLYSLRTSWIWWSKSTVAVFKKRKQEPKSHPNSLMRIFRLWSFYRMVLTVKKKKQNYMCRLKILKYQ